MARLLAEQERTRGPLATQKKKKKKDTKKAEAEREETSSSEEEGEEEEEEAEPGSRGGDERSRALVVAAPDGTSNADGRAAALAGPVGRVWTEACDGDGAAYYYNAGGEAVWELPEGDTARPEGDFSEGDPEGLGAGDGGAEFAWEAEPGREWAEAGEEWAQGGGESGEEWAQVVDDQGGAYWYNAATGETAYE